MCCEAPLRLCVENILFRFFFSEKSFKVLEKELQARKTLFPAENVYESEGFIKPFDQTKVLSKKKVAVPKKRSPSGLRKGFLLQETKSCGISEKK